MKRWYGEEKIAMIMKHDEFSSIYQNYVRSNIKFINNEWMKDMKNPNTPNVTREQFINQDIIDSVKWIRSKYAGNMDEVEDKFFDVYTIEGNKDGASIIFTPFVAVDHYGNAGYNNKKIQIDLSAEDKIYYILPDRLAYSNMIGAISGKVYSSVALNQEFRLKLNAYLPDNFALERHLGILSHTYEKEWHAGPVAASN